MRMILILLMVLAAMLYTCCADAEAIGQQSIPYMEDWPKLPSPFIVRSWEETARQVTLLALDPAAEYPFFPVSALFRQATPLSGGAQGQQFGLQTYLRSTPARPSYGEAVAQLSAIVTASLTEGIDPRQLYGMDYVQMAQAYFSRTPDGRGFVSNNTPVDDCADSFWYTLYPTCLYLHLAALHPDDPVLEGHMREIADTWLEELPKISTWDAQGYSLKEHRVIPGSHTEPEGILGAAYVMLMAYERFDDPRYLDAAVSLMEQAAERTGNPYYEILGSYAPYVAARLNAEENAGLPLGRMLDWVFNDGSEAARPGWGVLSARWGDYDAYGLAGSLTDTQGYAFSMNTFVTAGMLAPVARYAPQYSRALGQYLTAVAANSQMFFADGLPAQLQDDSDYTARTGLTCLVYEGVRNQGRTTPFATGDAKVFAPGVEGTNFSFYSSGPIGLFSSIIGQTSVPEILAFDLLRTDFEHDAAYPTWLLYNPLEEQRSVSLALPDEDAHDVYDAVSGQYLGRDVRGSVTFMMAADTAVQAVILPAGVHLTENAGRVEADGVVVRHAPAWVELPGAAEYAILREGDALPLEAHLPGGDRVISCRVTLDGQEIARADSPEEPIRLTLPGGTANRAVLDVTVETAQGLRLGFSRSIQVLPADMEALLQLTNPEMKKAFQRTDNCRVYQEENGLRLKITRGSSSFRLPMMTLDADQSACVTLKADPVSAAWGVQLYINNTGETVTLQPERQKTGEYLISLDGVLHARGLEQANVRLLFTLSSGSVGEVTLKELTVYASPDNP